MLNQKSFLAVDFGATNLKVAEFEVSESGGLLLQQYGFKSLGQDGTQEATRESAMLKALTEALGEKGFKARQVNVCAPGFHTFSKFVKLPPVDTSKVTQIIQYEAQQNVPFPLEEVVWDYQILGSTPTGELEVLLVAIKSDVVEGLFRTAEKSGLTLNLVDVSSAALSNAFRFNYGDLDGCTMLLDIGAKTSNLLFFEKGSIYSRGINIGANSITQDFAKESKISYDEAEQMKVAEGFVSLGGAYEEPDSPQQAAISKIARQVLTRLHIQVNQTIQFYRGQQGGAPPERLFLSGGATSMPYTAQFFSEKLNLPVEYFNPLRNVQLGTAINREELAKVAHSLGEVVGLGLRNLARCPVDLNLMPKSSKKRQEFTKRKPYLAAAALVMILIVFASGFFYSQIAKEREAALDELKQRLAPLDASKQPMTMADNDMKRAAREEEHYTVWLEDRMYWAKLVAVLRETMLAVEDRKEKDLGTPNVGVWVEKMAPVVPEGFLTGAPNTNALNMGVAGGPQPVPPAEPPKDRGRGGATVTDQLRERLKNRERSAPATAGGAAVFEYLLLTCRSVNLKGLGPNNEMAVAVQDELKSRTNYFDASQTKILGEVVGADSTNLLISFQVQVKLTRPMKL